MQTLSSDQHGWKYFLKTRKTRINLKFGFPFESGSVQSIGLSISKLFTVQPFKTFHVLMKEQENVQIIYIEFGNEKGVTDACSTADILWDGPKNVDLKI